MKWTSIVVLWGCASSVMAHEVGQRLGGYKASDGESRSAGGMSGTIDHGAFGSSPLTSASYNVDAGVERIRYDSIVGNKYMEENFPTGSKIQKNASLNTSHTVQKLTDVRVGGTWSSDNVTSSKSASAGMGHWWFSDTIQTNLDVSRTVTDRPYDFILDYDAERIDLSPQVNSGGATVAIKHLATPTTIWGTSYTRVESSDRPRLDAYSAQIKQFIPAWAASVHGTVTRIINTGTVSTNTTSGSLAGSQAELAFLKSLWQGASSRIAYRFVREDEHTRAYGDHLVYGADSYTAGISQDIRKGVITDRAMTASAVATRYMSNGGLGATAGEAGLAVKF